MHQWAHARGLPCLTTLLHCWHYHDSPSMQQSQRSAELVIWQRRSEKQEMWQLWLFHESYPWTMTSSDPALPSRYTQHLRESWKRHMITKPWCNFDERQFFICVLCLDNKWSDLLPNVCNFEETPTAYATLLFCRLLLMGMLWTLWPKSLVPSRSPRRGRRTRRCWRTPKSTTSPTTKETVGFTFLKCSPRIPETTPLK